MIATTLVVLLLSSRARAAEYGVDLQDVREDDDLYQLFWDGLIDEETRDRLVTLFAIKVDLNNATREELMELPRVTAAMADDIIAYREREGGFRQVEYLGLVPSMQGDPFVQALPFVSAQAQVVDRGWSASAQAGAIATTRRPAIPGGGGVDTAASNDPAFFLRGRSQPYEHLRLGVLVTARSRLGQIEGAPDGGSLTAEPRDLRYDLPGIYAMWDGPRLAAIAGTYRLGFGQRLVLDNSRRARPHGPYPNDDLYESTDSAKITPIDGFVGAAVRARYLPWRFGWFDLTGFFSWADKDLYFQELAYSRADTDPFVVDPEGETIQYATLPDIVRERLGGANLTHRWSRRASLGVTGYLGDARFNAEAPDLGFNLSSRYPEDRTRFGAVGVDGTWGAGVVDLGAEVAVTDRGEPGVLARAWIEPVTKLQIMPSARYYAPDFDNPYARGEANADETLGNRARDELGGRVRVSSRQLKLAHFIADVDVWRHENPERFDPETGEALGGLGRPTIDMILAGRVDLHPTTKEQISLWTTYHDEDVENGGRALAYASSTQPGGARITAQAMVQTRRVRRVALASLYRHAWVDTTAFDDRFDQDLYVWWRAILDLAPGPAITARLKYRLEGLDEVPARGTSYRYCEDEEMAAGTLGEPIPADCRGERYWETLLLVRQRLYAQSWAKLRFSWTRYFDRRAKWIPLPSVNEPEPVAPPRDDFLIKASVILTFS